LKPYYQDNLQEHRLFSNKIFKLPYSLLCGLQFQNGRAGLNVLLAVFAILYSHKVFWSIIISDAIDMMYNIPIRQKFLVGFFPNEDMFKHEASLACMGMFGLAYPNVPLPSFPPTLPKMMPLTDICFNPTITAQIRTWVNQIATLGAWLAMFIPPRCSSCRVFSFNTSLFIISSHTNIIAQAVV